MKTKFTIDILDTFCEMEYSNYSDSEKMSQIETDKALELFYLNNYKKSGWILDKKNTTVYMIFDEPLYLTVGEDVRLDGEDRNRIITRKIINLTNEYIEYILDGVVLLANPVEYKSNTYVVYEQN